MTATTNEARESRPISALQRGALIGLVVLAVVIGAWSYFWPRDFFDHFPVVLGEWISQDGPFNEHLARDHGAMSLALGGASAYGLVRASQPVYRAMGIAWTVFGVLHVAYHVAHLGQLSATEAMSQVTALVVAVLLGTAVMIPGPPKQ